MNKGVMSKNMRPRGTFNELMLRCVNGLTLGQLPATLVEAWSVGSEKASKAVLHQVPTIDIYFIYIYYTYIADLVA